MSTPPPQGQNPFAPQPGQPHGQQPYGQQPAQQPYGQPGPAPYGQPGQAPYGYPGAPVPPPAPRRRGGKKYIGLVIPVLVLAVVAGNYVFNSDDTKKLAVGDCLQNKGGDGEDLDIEKLDCTDSKATHKVLKKSEGTSLGQVACMSVEGTTAFITLEEGSDSFVLCLGDNK